MNEGNKTNSEIGSTTRAINCLIPEFLLVITSKLIFGRGRRFKIANLSKYKENYEFKSGIWDFDAYDICGSGLDLGLNYEIEVDFNSLIAQESNKIRAEAENKPGGYEFIYGKYSTGEYVNPAGCQDMFNESKGEVEKANTTLKTIENGCFRKTLKEVNENIKKGSLTNKNIDDDRFHKLFSFIFNNLEYTSINISIENRDVTKEIIRKYITDFKNNDLETYYNYEKQLNLFRQYIKSVENERNIKHLQVTADDFYKFIQDNDDIEQYNFLELLLSADKKQYIEIKSVDFIETPILISETSDNWYITLKLNKTSKEIAKLEGIVEQKSSQKYGYTFRGKQLQYGDKTAEFKSPIVARVFDYCLDRNDGSEVPLREIKKETKVSTDDTLEKYIANINAVLKKIHDKPERCINLNKNENWSCRINIPVNK